MSAPSPLRPYYIPRDPLDALDKGNSSRAAASADYRLGGALDYDSYLDTANTKELLSTWANDLGMSYLTCLIGQPFEVAKTVLQVQYRPNGEHPGRDDRAYEEADEDSDSEPAYFESSPPSSPPLRPRGTNVRTDREGYVLDNGGEPSSWEIAVPKPSIRAVLGALWRRNGPWSVWRGTNATFVYSFVSTTLDSWTSSLLSAIFNLPDPAVTEIADSVHPYASLGLVVASCAMTAILLSPLDVLRIRTMVTPSNEDAGQRSSICHFRSPPFYVCPSWLVFPTTLHAVIPSFITNWTPLFLRTSFGIDPLFNSTLFSTASFMSEVLELSLLLPVETVLRRAQLHASKPSKAVVKLGPYYGTFSTMWSIYRKESRSPWGIDGLYRGWKIGMWGILGKMSVGVLGFGQSSEFVESEF